jgi:hypothetical protein
VLTLLIGAQGERTKESEVRRPLHSRRAECFVEDKIEGNRDGVKPFVGALSKRVEQDETDAGRMQAAEGKSVTNFSSPEGDLEVPSGIVKNGDTLKMFSNYME